LNRQWEQRATIRQYLLGQLPEAERPEFEERLLAEDLFYQELLIEEDELVDEYLADSLDSLEREQFENYFLRTPERERKIRFGKALRRYVSSSAASEPGADPVVVDDRQPSREFSRVRPRSWFSFLPDVRHTLAYSFAVIVCLIAIGVVWLAIRHRLKPQPSGDVFAVVLVPGGTRDTGDGMKKFSIPSGTGTLRLTLELAQNDCPIYQAIISDANDKLILRANNLRVQSKAGRPSLVVDVEASLIPPHDYQVKLSGMSTGGQSESVARYAFRVVK
jgi:hypothetical protein